MPVSIVAALLGALVGVILGLPGAGSAIIAVPLLVFGLQLRVAEGPHPLHCLQLASRVAPAGIETGRGDEVSGSDFIAFTGRWPRPWGYIVARQIPDAALSFLFAAVLAYIAISMFRRSGNHSEKVATASLLATPCQLDDFSGRLIWDARCARSLTLSGVVAGFLSGLLGVGGGFIIVPAFQKATSLHMRSIVSTSLAVIALGSAAGGFSAAFAGSMNWAIALSFAGGAVAAMLLAGTFADRFARQGSQKSFAILAAVVATGMGIKAIAVVTGISG